MSQPEVSSKQTFTAVTPMQRLLPTDLALLLAPVRASEPSAPDEYVGRADGVVLDEGMRVVAFIVRLVKQLDPGGGRTLVPVTRHDAAPGAHAARRVDRGSAPRAARLDADLAAHNVTDGGPPIQSQWMPARPNVVPPGSGSNGTEAAKEGVQGSLIGAALGALAGLAIGGPIAAASLAMFFAAGESLAGVISGASQETAPQASELDFAPLAADDRGALGVLARSVGGGPAQSEPLASGLVDSMRFRPMTTTRDAVRRGRAVAGWR